MIDYLTTGNIVGGLVAALILVLFVWYLSRNLGPYSPNNTGDETTQPTSGPDEEDSSIRHCMSCGTQIESGMICGSCAKSWYR
jgi:hypothetical protein